MSEKNENPDSHRRVPDKEIVLIDALGDEHQFESAGEAMYVFGEEIRLWQTELLGLSDEERASVLGPLMVMAEGFSSLQSADSDTSADLFRKISSAAATWAPHAKVAKTFAQIRDRLGGKYASAFFDAFRMSPFRPYPGSEETEGVKLRLAESAALDFLAGGVTGDASFESKLAQQEEEYAEATKIVRKLRKDLAHTQADTLKFLDDTKGIIRKESQALSSEVESGKLEFRKRLEELQRSADETIRSLEQKYEDKLRFEKPSDYWRERAKSLRWQGALWSVFLVGGVAGSAGALMWYLLQIAVNDWSLSFGVHSLPSVAGFLGVLGAIGFGLRFLGRMTYSAFHLQRDAEERLQLTNFYLALGEDANKDPDTRNMVLQALFSRSDSGLLGGDHSPVLPRVVEFARGGGSTGP